MSQKNSACILGVFLLFACQSNTFVITSPEGESSLAEEYVQQVLEKITLAQWDELNAAETDLLEYRNQKEGMALLYFVQELRYILYEWNEPGRPYSLEADHPFYLFFVDIRQGKIPTSLPARYSILYLAYAPMVLLAGGDDQVWDMTEETMTSGEILGGSQHFLEFLKGLLSYQKGDWTVAQDHLEQSIRIYRKMPLARYFLALSLFENKDYIQSRKQLEILLLEYPQVKEVSLSLGRLSYQEEQYAEALEYFSNSGILQGRDILLQVSALQKVGSNEDALTLLSTSSTEGMDRYEYWRLYTELQKTLKISKGERLNILQSASLEYPQEKTFGTMLLDLYRDTEDLEALEETLVKYDSLLEKQEKHQYEFYLFTVREDWKRAAPLALEHPDIVPSDYLYRWELDLALQNWSALITRARRSPATVTLDRLADYWKALKETGDLEQLASVLNSRPLSKEWPLVLKGHYYYYLAILTENSSAKFNYLRQSLALNPISIDALVDLAVLYAQDGDFFQGSFYLEQAILLDPDNKELKELLFKWQEE